MKVSLKYVRSPKPSYIARLPDCQIAKHSFGKPTGVIEPVSIRRKKYFDGEDCDVDLPPNCGTRYFHVPPGWTAWVNDSEGRRMKAGHTVSRGCLAKSRAGIPHCSTPGCEHNVADGGARKLVLDLVQQLSLRLYP